MNKSAIFAIADRLLTGDADAIEKSVCVVCAESQGSWHDRGRAMMCRRLMHVQLSPGQERRLLEAIHKRLVSGAFSEQFRDQLRLAMRLDFADTCSVARTAATSGVPHISRYAVWVLSHDDPVET